MKDSYAKELTANDIGTTGSHQGGICVPRQDRALLDFFPRLDEGEFNPDIWIFGEDPDGELWKLRYVYYNGKIHEKSSRNEYRITYLTKFFRKWNVKEKDFIVFKSTEKKYHFMLSIEKPTREIYASRKELDLDAEPPVIVLSGWRKVH